MKKHIKWTSRAVVIINLLLNIFILYKVFQNENSIRWIMDEYEIINAVFPEIKK